MRRRPTTLRVVCLAAAAGGACAASVQGQTAQPQEGPVIVGERKEGYRGFQLESVQAGLEFFGESRLDQLRGSGQPTLKDRELTLRETLDLGGEVYIGHKNLIDITGGFKIGVEDRFIKSDTLNEDAHETDFLGLYDVSALILQNGPVPITLYSRRDEGMLDRDFAGTIRTTTAETGAIAQFKSDVAPTTLHYFHRDETESDQLGTLDDTLVQDTFTANSDIRISDNQHLQIDYTFDHVNETQAGGAFHNVFDRHDATFTDLLDFGLENRNNLRSSLRYYNESGLYPQEVVRLDEQLLLRHTDRFETHYDITLENQERSGASQRLFRGETTARYRLFDSLVASATAGAQRLDVPDDFTSDDLFVQGSLDYTKTVPYGRVDAGASAGFDAQRNSARGGTISVLNEAYVFTDPFPIVISRPNIVPGSIVVTDASGIITYLPGSDYTEQIFPSHAEIRVIIGGGIVNGQSLQISYDLGPEPANDVDTTTTGTSFRYTLTESILQGLSGYVSYRTVDHNISASDPSLFVLDNLRDLTYGVEYNRGPVTLTAERENHDSTINPFDATRFVARIDERLGTSSTVGLDFTHDIIDYRDPSDHVVFDRIGGRVQQRFGHDLDLNVRLLYRNESDRLSGDSHGLEEIVELHWRRRQTQVFASFRNSVLDGPGSNTLSQTIQLGIRRAF